MKILLVILMLLLLLTPAYSQTDWVQKLDGWIDGVYQPSLFLGGNYFTKVSFADIDGDGDYDMFYGGGGTGRFKLFENIGTPTIPIFRLKDLIVPGLFGSGGSVDADFADIDGDGDLDAVVLIDQDRFSIWLENIGNATTPIWAVPAHDEVIGGFGPSSAEDFNEDGRYDIINGLHDSTIYLFEDTSQTGYPHFQQITNHLGHINVGNTFNMDVKDLDGDGDYDIVACVIGGVNKYYKNIGGPGNFQFVLADSNFLGGQYTPDWLECPELVDIDADGDLDLFLAGAYGRLNYFENIGTPQIPQFVHRYDTTYFYIFPHNVEGARFVDIDGDGDLDISASRSLIRNLGPIQDPAWQIEANVFPSILHKEFLDIDGDGDQDMIFPASYLGVMLYRNIGTPQIPEWDSVGYIVRDNNTLYIASLAMGDLDNDGDYDMLMDGTIGRDLIYYENTGDIHNPQFSYVTDSYAGFHRNRSYPGEPFYPALGDIDNDGDLDLLIAYDCSEWEWPKLLFYENIGTPEHAVWDSITDDYMHWFSSGLMYFSYVDFGDYDHDGDQDLLLSYWQGLRLMLNQTITGIEEDSAAGNGHVPSQPLIVKTYPNPFNGVATFSMTGSIAGGLTIDIYNILGQQVYSIRTSEGRQHIEWQSGNNPSGMYFYCARSGQNTINGKFVLLK